MSCWTSLESGTMGHLFRTPAGSMRSGTRKSSRIRSSGTVRRVCRQAGRCGRRNGRWPARWTPCATGQPWDVYIPEKAVENVMVTVKSREPGTDTTLRTNERGQIALTNFAPGAYELVVDGESLKTAVDKLVVPSSHKSSGPTISVGGFFGGGSSRSSSSGHKGVTDAAHERGSHSSGGGMGVGLSLPLGGNDDNPPASGDAMTSVTISLPANGGPNARDSKANWDAGANSLSMEAPYCHDSAAQGLRIRFTVPPGHSRNAVVTFGLESADSTLNE